MTWAPDPLGNERSGAGERRQISREGENRDDSATRNKSRCEKHPEARGLHGTRASNYHRAIPEVPADTFPERSVLGPARICSDVWPKAVVIDRSRARQLCEDKRLSTPLEEPFGAAARLRAALSELARSRVTRGEFEALRHDVDRVMSGTVDLPPVSTPWRQSGT